MKFKILLCLLVAAALWLLQEVTDVKEVTPAPTLPSSNYQLEMPE